MRRAVSWLGATACLAAVLVGCADDAEPASSAAGPGATSSSPPEPTATASPSPTRTRRSPRVAPSPSITVPDLSVPPLFNGPVTGGDVSWPQCPKGMGIPQRRTLGIPMPLPSARFVIIGLTNGPAFTPNPCLASQVSWVKERRLMAAAYAVNSYPDRRTLERYGSQGPYDGTTRLGALKNVGYQQAMFNVGNLRAAELQTPIIWLDVEPVSIFEWSSDKQANAAVVVGAARGYTDAGYQIGTYSTQYLWEGVVGGLRLGVPEWRAAGQTSRAEALRRCGASYSFQGGDAVISQWVELNRDRNITCPGTERAMYRWFHQY